MSEYEEFKEKIVSLQHIWEKFRVDFIDRDDFKKFADKLNKKGSNLEKCLYHWLFF